MSEIIEIIKQRQKEAVIPTAQVTGALKEGIALCLSGGGYRAALFHLGVMGCLHDMGILQTVKTVSSVSGGSIMAAYMAKRMLEENIPAGMRFENWEEQVSAGFRSFVLNDIRTLPILVHLAWNWLMPKWRARHLQRNYGRKLLTISKNGQASELTLGDLPEKPYFAFCSTDLTFGVNWIFTREEIGDYKVGYADAKEWPLATAVTASSSFPPIFGPLMLSLDPEEFRNGSYSKPDRANLLANIRLTDGGVYDNLGLEPVDRGYETIIASDGGSPFGYVGTGGPLRRLLRYTSVIMSQVAALRKRMFFTGISKKWYQGIYVNISHARGHARVGIDFDGYVDESVRGMISGIRTDLDQFNEAEACILENHGYFETHNRVTRSLPDLIKNPVYKPMTPHAQWEDETLVSSALQKSGKRFSFGRLWNTIR